MTQNTKSTSPDKPVERILVIAGRIPFVLTIMAFLLIIAGTLSYYIHPRIRNRIKILLRSNREFNRKEQGN